MGVIAETCRGAAASALWLAGMPIMNMRIAYGAKDKAGAHRLIANHCTRFMSACGAKTVLDGDPPAPGHGCVVCYNEASFMDVAAFGRVMWPHIDRAAAADLYGYFPFGRAAARKSQIALVPRGNRAGTDKLLNMVVAQVRSGDRLAWGGEGRITGGDGIGRFKIGASLIAIRAQAPVVPVVFYGGHHVMPFPSVRAKPGTIHVRFGTPIATAGLTDDDIPALRDRLHGVMVGMYDDLRRWAASDSA